MTMLVVDAANVVGSRPDGWWRDRAGAATRLLAAVRAGLATDDEVDGAVVVLEGAARAGAAPGTAGGVRVVHADGSGDDAIVALVASVLAEDQDRSVTVVSADRELRTRVEELGAHPRGPGWLWRRLKLRA